MESETSSSNIFDFLVNTQLNWDNTISYIPNIKYGKVIKVYDGDTVTIATPLFNGSESAYIDTYRFNLRLLGINAPEIKTTDKQERELAIEAKNFLFSLVMDKIVRLENVSIEKYGRVLCDVFIHDSNLHVNKAMVENGFAVPYMV
jgi:micrococcal nuclease